MQRIAFSTDMLPGQLTSEQKARQWADMLADQGNQDADCPSSAGFRARIDLMRLGNTIVSRSYASSIRLTRLQRHAAIDGKDDILLLICDGAKPLGAKQRGKEVIARRGDTMVINQSLPNSTYALDGGHALGLLIPRISLGAAIPAAEDLAGHIIDRRTDALRLLRGYLRVLLSGEGPSSPEVGLAAEAHLAALATLALGARSDGGSPNSPDVTPVRAALLIDAISRRACEPDLSPDSFGKPMRLSGRSVQHILHAAGTTFSGEVREARLRLAESMLGNADMQAMSIIDVSLSCGFSDVSTFYRAFHARFGTTPTDMRRAAAETRRRSEHA